MSDRSAGGRRAPDAGWIGWLERRLNLTEIFSFLAHFGFVFTPVDTTRPFREAVREAAAQPVPVYARWPRVLGILAVILFALQAGTGVLLACYYQPTPEAAFTSTRTIVRDLPLGWFLHQMHAWGAYLLIAVLLLRLARLFWDGLYRAPREVLWLGGVALAWVAVQADFTGRLLAWDTHSYWSVVRGLEVLETQPVVGPALAFLIGGRVVSGDVLTRFYVLHVLVLPAVFLAFLYLTFATLRRVGLAPAPGPGPARTTTLADHLNATLVLAVLVFGVLVSLAVLAPFPFLAQADPYATPAGARPPWYLLAPYALLQRMPGPAWLWGLVLTFACLAVASLPFWQRGEGSARGPGRARLAGALVAAAWLALTVLGAFLDRR
jgi:quinol-cytochrome oxidoreductase complex cytochrome b subunit